MSNIILNTLKYTGVVTLSQYVNSKKVKIAQQHNEGGNSLFNFLAECLAGDFTLAKTSRPTKIMLIEQTKYKDEAGNFTYTTPNDGGGFFQLLTKPEKVEDPYGSHVRYSFVIPKEVIGTLSNFDNLYLGLYHDGASLSDPNEYAAICKLNLTANSLINASLVVDWDLMISNISTTA